MKKLLPMILAGAMTLSMAACGGDPAPENSKAPDASDAPAASTDYSDVKIAVMLPGSPTDGGYCQQGADGIRAIQEKYNLDDSQVSIIDSVSTADMARAEAENMAADGYKVIFGQGGQFAEYFKEVAPDYPDTWFITNGGAVTGDNQFPMCMSTEEGGYVCGVIAGMMTKSNVVGVLPGGDFPSYTKPGVGFSLGAKSVNPDIEVKFTTLANPNPNEAYETALNQINSGVDFLFPNADEGTPGAIKAIAETDGMHGFGVFGDYCELAPDKMIGSSLVNTGDAYTAAFESVMNGTATGEVEFMGMAEGVIEFRWNEELKSQLPKDVIDTAEQAIEDIKAGKVEIPNEYDIGETGPEMYFN